MIIQFCGLSGSGKTTLAAKIKRNLKEEGMHIEIIDGDVYRQMLSPDLGFSREDRYTNIRRLAFVASRLSAHNIIAIICAINPYAEIRKEITSKYPDVRTVFIKCGIDTLIERDTKGLYMRAMLPDRHPDKVTNLTGVNDPFEEPEHPDLILDTEIEDIEESVTKLINFILDNFKRS